MTDYLSAALSPPPRRHLTYSKSVQYTPAVIFSAISDVSSYSSFLPFISSSSITSRDSHGLPTSAKLKVGYPTLALEEEWHCRVMCAREPGVIISKSAAEYKGNVFEEWVLKWKIQRVALKKDSEAGLKATTVKLELEVKCTNLVYDQMFALLEDRLAEKIMAQFEWRFAQVHAVERKQQVQKVEKKVESLANPVVKARQSGKAAPQKLEIRSGNKAAATE